MISDFTEISHTGGKTTFEIKKSSDGTSSYSVQQTFSGPNPAALIGIYVHRDGFACANVQMGGIGSSWNAPPLPNCYPVFMASDTQGKFAHECPVCKKQFRSNSFPATHALICPYCRSSNESFHYLTQGQNNYISHYLETLFQGLESISGSGSVSITIDMDAVVGLTSDSDKPTYFYTSTKQQTEIICTNCNSYTDILGKYGFCSNCGRRNTADQAKKELSKIRDRLNEGVISAEEALKQSVSTTDSAFRDYYGHV